MQAATELNSENSVTHTIGIAGLKVASSPDQIRTTLGSCIGIAIFDRIAKVGGLAHILLPSSGDGRGDRGKFADTAIDWLLEEVLSAGCKRERLIAKISGGASMFGPKMDKGLGERNISAVKERLRMHAIRLASEDCGGEKGRRMTFEPGTGKVTVHVIGADEKVI